MTRSAAALELDVATKNAPAKPDPIPLGSATIRYMNIDGAMLTLSLFGQIDTVPYPKCDPIARVRPPMAGRYVIGSDNLGMLVKASLDAAWPQMPSTPEFRREAVAELRRLLLNGDQDDPSVVDRRMVLEGIERVLPAYEAALTAYDALPLIVLARR